MTEINKLLDRYQQFYDEYFVHSPELYRKLSAEGQAVVAMMNFLLARHHTASCPQLLGERTALLRDISANSTITPTAKMYAAVVTS